MNEPFIFVSCGQFTPAEKSLGKSITAMVKSVTGMNAFFAEEVQDIKGLDTSILVALRDCSGFITVLHPRGKISRHNGNEYQRASVWIEQEIAIATYITRVEKRELPVIAFIHKSVGREGIRDLLHLNPIEFTEEMEVLAALPARLQAWGKLEPTGIVPQVKTTQALRQQDGHQIRQITFSILNDTDSRILQISGIFRIPAGILKHWSNSYGLDEERSDDPRYRIFRFDEGNTRAIQPRSTGHIATYDYCIQCAIDDTHEGDHLGGLFVSEYEVELTVWIAGRKYQTVHTVKELSQAAAGQS
ncbi:MAG TPA: hypothetical protein VIB39_04795 [Candidatus Angelobacter sp.]